jgi:hypothetical protein
VWPEGSAECACSAALGLAPLNEDQRAFAAARLGEAGACQGSCCAASSPKVFQACRVRAGMAIKMADAPPPGSKHVTASGVW